MVGLKCIIISFILLLFQQSNAQSEIWNKLLVTEQARPEFSINGMAIDQFNNKYLINFVEDLEGLVDTTILYLYKYNALDELIWSKKLIEGNSLQSIPFAFEVDGRGNIYLGINFSNQIVFEKEIFLSKGNSDGLFAKLDKDGNLLYSKQFGGDCSDAVREIKADDLRNIYFGGQFGFSRFDSDLDCDVIYENEILETDKSSNSDYFLMKLDEFGNLLWLHTGGGWSFDALYNITIEENKVYFSGFSTSISSIQLNNYNLFVPKGLSIYTFLAKADATTGEVIWASYAGNSGALNLVDPKSLKTTKYGVSLLGVIDTGDPGQSNRLLIRNSEPLVWEGLADTEYFLINYDTSGNVNWARKGLHLSRDNVQDLVIDKKDNHYVAGYGPVGFVFNNDTIFSQGGNDIFVACYNANGEEQWIKTAGGKGNDTANSIALDQAGRIYVCGGTSSHPVTFGNITVEPPHPNNVFLARLSDDPILNIIPINKNLNQTTVYPNPANKQLWLQQNANKQTIKNLFMYDVQGNLINQTFKTTNAAINVEHLATGIYFLKIVSANGTQQTIKWCKQ